LFLDKRDLEHALESVDEALRHNPNSAAAHALKARLEIDRAFDFPAATEHLDRAEAINPNLVATHVTRAMMALRNMELAEADRHIDRALAVQPNDLEALSVRAAVRFLADDEPGFAKAQQDVLARNPRYSRMYSVIARYAEWEHRYEELVDLARAALRIDPEDALAHATLGINLLRTGDERGGLSALNAAWDRDRFNVHVYNMLNLYDEVISKDYVEVKAKPFVVRMHREERRALEPYVVPALRAAYGQLHERYHFTPKGPLRVEMYADRRHFSVRTTGLPNVAVQGVCFGKVITAISPRGGPFNWGQITWHELAHVFHLQLSRSRVPRWFTEGLAEHETSLAHPEWRREEDRALWLALRHDRVPAIGDLNRSFTEARTPDDLMTAYYAAYVAVGYIAQRFGFEKIRAMLLAWGAGKRTPKVVEESLGLDLTALDRDFRAHLKQRLRRFDQQFHVDFSKYESLESVQSAVDAAPNDPDRLADLALVHLVHEQYDEAEKAGLKAIKLVPHHAAAHFALTRVALEKGDVKRAYRCLRAIIDGGTDGPIVRLLLTRAALALKKEQEAREHVLAAARLDPDDIENWRAALDVAEKTTDRKLARRALTAIVDLDQHDGAAHIALLAILEGEHDHTTLRSYAERALFVDPENPGLHRQLGAAYLHTGAAERALVELDRALALGYRRPGRVHVLKVRALQSLGRKKAARAEAKRAVRADPKLRQQVRDALGD
jgi:tetratricopeptide (TPR) repeat protein